MYEIFRGWVHNTMLEYQLQPIVRHMLVTSHLTISQEGFFSPVRSLSCGIMFMRVPPGRIYDNDSGVCVECIVEYWVSISPMAPFLYDRTASYIDVGVARLRMSPGGIW